MRQLVTAHTRKQKYHKWGSKLAFQLNQLDSANIDKENGTSNILKDCKSNICSA